MWFRLCPGVTSFEYNARVSTSYPLDDHTWVVTAGAHTSIELDVYCLHGNHLPTVVIASETGGRIACPAGFVLLTEGFGRLVVGTAVRPSEALCATAGMEEGTLATAPVTFASNHNGYMRYLSW